MWKVPIAYGKNQAVDMLTALFGPTNFSVGSNMVYCVSFIRQGQH